MKAPLVHSQKQTDRSEPNGTINGSAKPAMTAFYDGGCPVCRMEVRHYMRIGGDAVEWVDVCSLDDRALAQVASGKTRGELLGAMHVRDGENWQIGVAAFPALWRKMPGWKHFTWVFRVPGAIAFAEIGYRGFLAWQRRHRTKRTRTSNRN
jgi:predicted DCC family thiol-disulfide oxidoreductase YuxK